MSRGGGMGMLRHGETLGSILSPEYRAWNNMQQRCGNPKNSKYRFYGARGITVCQRWQTKFENFLADVGRRPSTRHSLDRFPNPNGNYEPNNVRWATRKQQFENRDCTHWVTLHGRRMTLSEACEITGINRSAAYKRISRGWASLDAVTRSPMDNGKN